MPSDTMHATGGAAIPASSPAAPRNGRMKREWMVQRRSPRSMDEPANSLP
jgi:hypothetical protein